MKQTLSVLLVLAVIGSAISKPATQTGHAANQGAPSPATTPNRQTEQPVQTSQPLTPQSGAPVAAPAPAFAPQPTDQFGIDHQVINVGLSQGIGSAITSAFSSLASGIGKK